MRTVILFLVIFSSCSFAEQVKMRAREHFDTHQITIGDTTETYRGLSNTINLWVEEPFKYSYGFYLNPVIGSAHQDESDLREIGTRLTFVHAGVEAKSFLLLETLFGRLGMGWSQLLSNGPLEASNGYNVYAGLGVEFKIGEVGVALEAAYRLTRLQNEIEATSFTPSIGFHFYGL